MFGNMLMGAAGASLAGGGGYSVDNSIVLDDGSSQYLTGPTLSGGSERIGTYSFWTKRANLGTQQEIYTQYRTSSSNLAFRVRFLSGDTLDIVCENDAGGVILKRTTTQVFRDPHAFLHVHIQIDGNQTDDTCCTLTINGSAVSDFSTKTNLSSGTDLNLFTSSKSAFIGSTPGPAGYYDGYLSEFVAIDGSNAAATSFGEYDTNGVWRPIDVSGLTFGTNGFYLPFTTSTFLGADANNTGTVVNSYQSSQWTGNTGSYSFADGFIDATTVDDAINSVDTFTGDFELEFYITDKGNVCVGVYEIDEDGTFDQNSSTGGMSSMTDSWWIKTSSVAANNDVMYGSTEVAGTVGWADGDTVKITRSSGTFTVYRNGSSLHEWSQTSSNEVRIVVSQGDTNVILDQFCWVDAGTIANNFFTSGSPTQSSDTPTNLIATLSPLWTNTTLSNGNLTATAGTTAYQWAISTIPIPSTGKWVFEAARTSGTFAHIGVARLGDGIKTGTNDLYTLNVGNGEIVKNASLVTTVTTPGASVIRVEYDADTDTIEFFDDGVSVHSATMALTSATGPLVFVVAPYASGTSVDVTFDENNFAGTPSTGFLGLSSANLYTNAAPAIEDGTAHFQATAYTGNGSDGHEINQSGNSTFKPSFTWFKNRDVADSHALYDLVRGITKRFYSNSSAVETTTSHVASFDADGFTVNADTQVNGSGDGMIAWQWKGDGTSGASNTNGTITSTVNVDDTAGFSIVSYTGNGTDGATVGHGQTGILDMIIVKNRDAIAEPLVFHAGLTNGINGTYGIELSQTNAQTPTFGAGYIDGVTSSVFALQDGTSGRNNVNDNTEKYIAYCFRSIPGYSAFGSYESNTSLNGPLILTDFKPAFFMCKSIDAVGDWLIFDAAREPYNEMQATLSANTSGAENTSTTVSDIDFLSNGVKLREDNIDLNSSGTYIYAAFAEYPFAGSSPATAR